MSMTSLLPYWPTLENVKACISAEAETSSSAIFLAAHQRMKFECMRVGGGQETEIRDERVLLEAFMEDKPPEGRVILPIIGSSGVGKSHVIRWLDVQLQRHPRYEHLHIIRIPKGSSLKGVLRLILEKLSGPAYAAFRKKLNEAHEQLDPDLAAKMLLTNLRHLLVKASEAATERLAAKRSQDPDRDKLLKNYGTPRALPALLGDPVLESALFLGTPAKPGIVTRLAEQVTKEGGSDVDQRVHQFESSHFRVPDELVPEMNAQARNFYSQIAKEGEHHRAHAASLLNGLLDQAKQELLRMGDNTLTELFVDVRAQLFKEQKELILLVEDFAVLSGLQGALLDVMIREAYRDGKQVLCTIRSALAYTEGYMLKDTVRTRARIEWLIPERDNDVISRAVDLVGGYLNAARLGRDTLTETFNARSLGTTGEWSAEWAPRFEHDLDEPSAQVLDAFGTSSQGHPLFPFNRPAIERLVGAGSQGPDGRPLFNPRNIINNVLRETLAYRPEFQRGEFPNETFGTTEALSVDTLAEIRRLQPSQWKRYARVAAYWGPLPEAFQAFGLSALDLTGHFTIEEPKGKTSVSPAAPKPPAVNALTSKIQNWDQKLTEWHRGRNFTQAEARDLRNWIAPRVMTFIPWSLHMLQPPWDAKEVADRIFLPGGSTAETTEGNALFIVCTQREREDEQASLGIRNALLAIIRHELNVREWNYEGAERDSVRVAQFLTDRINRTVESARAQADEFIAPMVEVLLVGARCLGAKVGHSSDRIALVEALFEKLTPPAPRPDTQRLEWRRWDSVLEKSASVRSQTQGRSSAQDILLQQVGARQGDGKDVHALDVVRLLPALESVKKSWSITSQLKGSPSKTLRALSNELSGLKTDLQPAMKKMSEELIELRRVTLAFLGEPFEKEEIRTAFIELVESTSMLGVVQGIDPQALRQSIQLFYESPVKTVLDQVARLETEKTPGQALGLLAQLDRNALFVIETFIDQMNALLRNAGQAIKAHLDASGPDPIEAARNALVGELETIGRHLQSLRGSTL
ncbi:protein DpdH [Myxococcus sp. Y35]|uniref:protein DpdH n=1 Tax=Pseudomyxococcus flavus TaxID=3115648 RepID=UPI003CEFBE52